MKRTIIATMALLAGMYACQSPEDAGKDFVYRIDLDDAQTIESQLLLSDLCDEVQTIILETTDNSFLSRVNKLVHTNDRLYVFDMNGRSRQNSSVTEFDMDGKFIRKYGNVGRGPGEYAEIFDFSVDTKSGLMYLLDYRTGRLISYDLESGRYVDDMRVIDENGTRISQIASVGGSIYSDLNYRKFDKSNYMLKSFSGDDPERENYYLPIVEHLKGWSDVSMVGISKFIFGDENNHALFSNTYSPEIFKLTADGISNYIYIDSKDFVDENDRIKMCDIEKDITGPPAITADQILSGLDRFSGVSLYFETDRYICFTMHRGNSLLTFIYDKNSAVTQRSGFLHSDLLVKSEYYPQASGLFTPLFADKDGMFYYTRPERVDKLRTAAREGMLVDGLDRLDELKELPENSNPVLFYMKFKEPLR